MGSKPEPILRRWDEEVVRTKVSKNARKKCDPAIREFIECAKGRTVSIAWKCREQRDVMNECMKLYTTPQHFREMRREHAKDVPHSVKGYESAE
mmetsp:Transcript_6329/g.12614  ORF Transcript_6329/g.12614 Transcript_6329/m.12614 type:complete len:94 (+) Transcript_6329:196-477(+)